MKFPIAKEGLIFIFPCWFAAVGAWIYGPRLLEIIFLPLSVFVTAFFRDPGRKIPGEKDSVVSPADGKVIKVEKINDTRFLRTEALRISIFMNVFNVHVNRVPFPGKVVKIIYNPGKFFNASLDKASMENEQNALILESGKGKRFAFNQIAGLIARRIVCYAREGNDLSKGDRFGMIMFGSRVDVYLPASCRVEVKVGDKVRAGSSILGWWNA